MPLAVQAFLDEYDLSGKTIYLSVTHGGSRSAGIEREIAAAEPTDEIGGVNPKEVGLGMTVASIDTVFTQGNLQSTGIATDVAIQGNGFFLEKNGEKSYYTRAGAFSLDSDGTLVNPAKATANVNFACNLDKNTPEIPEGANAADVAKGTWNTEFKVYDSFGNTHLLSVNFTRVVGNPNL